MTTQTEQTSAESLMSQILERRDTKKNAIPQQETTKVPVLETPDGGEEMGGGSEGEGRATGEAQSKGKTFKFSKGEKNYEIDDDAVLEFMADKQPMKMTLRELRDAAAGGLAVRNRMRQVAEERKSLQEPYKNFSKSYKADPFNALKKVFSAISKVDPDVDFKQFIADLGAQAQNMAAMQPSERKAYMTEQELEDVKGQLTEAQRVQNLSTLKRDLIEQTGLSEEKVFSFGQEILNNPVLAQTVNNENDLMERIADLAEEVEMQQASHEALRKHKPSISAQDPLVFELSNLLKQNPDFDEQDLSDIAREVTGNVQRAQASQRLSKKQRFVSGSRSHEDTTPDFTKMKPADALLFQIEQKKKQQTTRR